MKSNANAQRMIAAASTRRRNAAAATDNAARDNNKNVVSFKTIENQTHRIGENSRMSKIAAAAKRRIANKRGKKETTEAEASVATNAVTNQAIDRQSLDFNGNSGNITVYHKTAPDDEGKKVRFSVAADPIPPSDGYLPRLAARRRLLSSATNNHKNTADDEGKIVNIERIHGGDPPSHVNHHTAITVDDERVTLSTKKAPRAAKSAKAKATPKSWSSTSSPSSTSSSSSCGSGYMSSPTLDSDDSDYVPKPNLIERIRGGGGNETGPATDQQEAVVAGPAAAYAIGTKIIKPFDGTPYKGEVISYDPEEKLYKVQYEDEDREELDSSEVKRYLVEEPINNNTEFEGISTSTTKTSKDDKKALYDWIVNASASNSLRFTVGSTRRKNLDKLVKNLVDTNTGLDLTQTSSDRILTIKINSKPSSAVIVPVVENKPEPWRSSEAKEYVTKELMREDSWINVEVNFAIAHGIPWSITAEEIRREEPLFRQYNSKLFNSNLMRLVETVREDQGRGQWDQDALNKEKLKYPINTILIQGYPRWNISSAKKLLEEDLKAKKHVGVLPRDLRVTRQDYIDFPLRIFRHRLYAEVRKQTGDAFWVHKRNKKMMKQKVANDNENDEIAANE
jgi:hypothetical protein